MFPFQAEFVANIFQFANSFNSLALNDTELGLFCAVVLLTPERNGVTDIKSVQHHQDRLLEALKVQVRYLYFEVRSVAFSKESKAIVDEMKLLLMIELASLRLSLKDVGLVQRTNLRPSFTGWQKSC